MYVSNQTRQRRYRKERQAEEANGDETQLQLFNYLSEQSLNDAQATQLAEMAARVGSKLTPKDEPDVNAVEGNDMRKSKSGNGFAKLLAAISSGKFDVFFNSMMSVDPKKLPPMVAAAQEVMKSSEFKKDVNKKLESLVEQNKAQPKTIANALIAALNENALFQKRVRSQSGESVNSNFSEVSEENKPSAEDINQANADLAQQMIESVANKVKDSSDDLDSNSPTEATTIEELLKMPIFGSQASFLTTTFKKDIEALTSKLTDEELDIALKRLNDKKESKQLLPNGSVYMRISSDGLRILKQSNRSTKKTALTESEETAFKEANLDFKSFMVSFDEMKTRYKIK